eukprot:TRINITY_DN3617_c0_g1_i2.p1 TRINITY_DN3617_c0_g1~~TRINITY_DN3617_c0_g1_i2.p1  ORF type:complete len:186 (-),score=27.50 TRINITY_DN3617_c0_g1_i2:409-966(-)
MVPEDRADCIMEMFAARKRMLEDSLRWPSTFSRVSAYEKQLQAFVTEHSTELESSSKGRAYLASMTSFVSQSSQRAAAREDKLDHDRALQELKEVYERVQKFIELGSIPLAEKEWNRLQELLPEVGRLGQDDEKIARYLTFIPDVLSIPQDSIAAQRYRPVAEKEGTTFTTQPPKTPTSKTRPEI